MKTKSIITASAAVLVLGGALAAAGAHSLHRGWGFHQEKGFERGLAMISWKLDLTDAQRTQVKGMLTSEWPTVQPMLQQLAGEQNQMLAATSNGAYDETKVKAIAEQQSQVIAQLLVLKERFISRVYNEVLNPEQRTKAGTMRRDGHNTSINTCRSIPTCSKIGDAELRTGRFSIAQLVHAAALGASCGRPRRQKNPWGPLQCRLACCPSGTASPSPA